MTIREFKAHLARWEKEGLTDDSLILAYSDKNGMAETEVGLMFLEGARPGSFGVMIAPADSYNEVMDAGGACSPKGPPRAADA